MITMETLTCSPTGPLYLERTRFFPRQLVTPDDLTQDQIYFGDKLRRHNRLLHGWGVVCGARVMPGAQTCQIVIESGYILGPYGDEIVIDQDVTVDLCHESLDGNAVGPCGSVTDPWCSNVQVNRPAGQPVYVAVRYAECQSRPVRVMSAGCGCNETDCEYSRFRDTYAIKVLNQLPSTYSTPMPQPDLLGSFSCVLYGNSLGRPCSVCPAEPWVILADVVLAPDGTITSIDCFAHRRYVVSFADYYFLCNQQSGTLVPGPVGPAGLGRAANRNVLVDPSAPPLGTPAANVPLQRTDGSWATLPIYFAPRPGDTIASLLAREGNRAYVDPAAGETYTLEELFALARVDPRTALARPADLVAPLAGLRLAVVDLRTVRSGLADLLDPSGPPDLERDFAGAPAAAPELPATDLRGAGDVPWLRDRLAAMNLKVGDVAGTIQGDFVTRAAEGAPASQRATVESAANTLWSYAMAVVKLARSWRGG